MLRLNKRFPTYESYMRCIKFANFYSKKSLEIGEIQALVELNQILKDKVDQD